MYVDYLMQVMNQNYLVEETEEQEAAEIEVDVLHEMVMSLGGSTGEIAFVYFPKLQVLLDHPRCARRVHSRCRSVPETQDLLESVPTLPRVL